MPLLKVDSPPPQTEVPEQLVGRLGRLKDPQDQRDYQVRRLLAAAPRIQRQNSRTWLPPLNAQKLNQGQTSSCVEHAITHAIYGHPQPRRVRVPWEHFALYHRAQQIDEWAGEEPSYYGTSIRAGLEAASKPWTVGEGQGAVLSDQPVTVNVSTHEALGPVESYHRVEDFEDLLDLLASDLYELGCSIVIGTDWSGNMFQVDKDGLLHFDRSDIAGGHAWWLNYVNLRRGLAGGLNSWGTSADESGMREGGSFLLPLYDAGLKELWDRGADGWVIVQRNSLLSRLAQKVLTS